jgi:hypothetical protein
MRKMLDGGLILRSLSEGHASDRENLGKFYHETFAAEGDEDTDLMIDWTEDLISDKHPTTTLDDIWVIVDPAKDDMIVSALLLIPQTWRYADIEFGVGRVELVATNKEYQRRGLVRTLITTAHERSAELGHIMQSITGIPHYYRRFGYAFTVDLGGRSALPVADIPKLKDDQEPQFTLRPATKDDIPNMIAWSNAYADQCLLSAVFSQKHWEYELDGRNPVTYFYKHALIIVNKDNKDVGYIVLGLSERNSNGYCATYIVSKDTSYLETFEDILRGIKTYTEQHYKAKDMDSMPRIGFDVGMPETVDKLIDNTWPGKVTETPYAWYIRIGDVAGFIQEITPVLERHLENSGAHRYSGELKISFYDTTGITISFKDGKITKVVRGEMHEFKADAAFPYHMFLNVLLGHRSALELRQALTEISINRKSRVLLDILFPKQRSWIMPIA